MLEFTSIFAIKVSQKQLAITSNVNHLAGAKFGSHRHKPKAKFTSTTAVDLSKLRLITWLDQNQSLCSLIGRVYEYHCFCVVRLS